MPSHIPKYGTLFEFKKDDFFYNTLKTHPKINFYIYSGSVYYNNENKDAINSHTPDGHINLHELNVNRHRVSASGDTQLIYPFTTKGGSGTSFKTISTSDFNLDYAFEDELKGTYPLTASISVDQHAAALAGTKKTTLYALKNTLDHYTTLSPHYAYSSSFGDKEAQKLNIISIPSIFYGSSIEKGSVKLKYYVTGTLVAEASDTLKNGVLIHTSGSGDVSASGSITVSATDVANIGEGDTIKLISTDETTVTLSLEGQTEAAATATITVIDSSSPPGVPFIGEGDTIKLISTDGTTVTLTMQGTGGSTTSAETSGATLTAKTLSAGSYANSTLHATAQADEIMRAINYHTKFSATKSSNVITVTQATTGADGNTTITITEIGATGLSKTDFTGGSNGSTTSAETSAAAITAKTLAAGSYANASLHATAQADEIMRAINYHTKFSAVKSSNVITVTQATAGASGNTTITITELGATGMSKTNFTGGITGDIIGSPIGVVLYNEGFILLTSSIGIHSHKEAYESSATAYNASWHYFGATGSHAGSPSSSFSIDFNGVNYVQTLTFFAHAKENQINFSNNPTFLSGSVVAISSSNIYHEDSEMDIKNIMSSSYKNHTASFQAVTYISKVGIYDENKNLIAIAALANPVRKLENTNYTFKFKLDI
jgi:hypothetical protein